MPSASGSPVCAVARRGCLSCGHALEPGIGGATRDRGVSKACQGGRHAAPGDAQPHRHRLGRARPGEKPRGGGVRSGVPARCASWPGGSSMRQRDPGSAQTSSSVEGAGHGRPTGPAARAAHGTLGSRHRSPPQPPVGRRVAAASEHGCALPLPLGKLPLVPWLAGQPRCLSHAISVRRVTSQRAQRLADRGRRPL